MKLNYFNFKRIKDKILLTNDFGDYAFISTNDFIKLLNKSIDIDSEIGKYLLSKRMIYDELDLSFINRNVYDLRNIKNHLNCATALHIFVVTTGCNFSCVYCQANNGINTSFLKMDKEMAERAVDIALQSPNKYLSFEFQGGEPLLNFEIIKYIVLYTEQHKEEHEISYSVVTNLTLITEEILDFFAEYKFDISTSVDGPALVHNINRPYINGTLTFDDVANSVQKIREKGIKIGAIQTTTKYSLRYPKEIVNAYKDLSFDSIFIRPLTPLGKAKKQWQLIGYTPDEFLSFYKQALNELFQINKNGFYLRENHATLLYNKINGNMENYMELRSPCGASIGQIAYYPDGNIFTCDEGRMLHEMGDSTFKLGNVFENNFNDLINCDVTKAVCYASMLETIPSCSDCVYQSYCGTCPVVNYANNNDLIEKEPNGYKCKIYSGMLDLLFEIILKEEQEDLRILNMWGN